MIFGPTCADTHISFLSIICRRQENEFLKKKKSNSFFKNFGLALEFGKMEKKHVLRRLGSVKDEEEVNEGPGNGDSWH